MQDFCKNNDIAFDCGDAPPASAQRIAFLMQQEQEFEEKAEPIRADYNQRLAEWEKTTQAIQKERNDAIDKAISEEEQPKLAAIEDGYRRAIEDIDKEMAYCEKEKKEAEAQLASLGIFKFAEKKAAKTKLDAAIGRISELEAQRQQAKRDRVAKKSALKSELSEKREKLEKSFEAANPLPPRPEVPAIALSDGTTVKVDNTTRVSAIELLILTGMEADFLYSYEDLAEIVNGKVKTTIQRVAAVVNKLHSIGCLEKVCNGSEVYFKRI